jgi:hypothetical protein
MINVPMDPLETTWGLLNFLEGRTVTDNPLLELARHLDSFMFSMRYVQTDDVPSIESMDIDRPKSDDPQIRKMHSQRFPMLGLYWTLLSPIIRNGVEPGIATGDAIDDLLDITKELREIQFLNQNHGRYEALAGLRWRYEHHLWMHVPPLRNYLEEMIFVGEDSTG